MQITLDRRFGHLVKIRSASGDTAANLTIPIIPMCDARGFDSPAPGTVVRLYSDVSMLIRTRRVATHRVYKQNSSKPPTPPSAVPAQVIKSGHYSHNETFKAYTGRYKIVFCFEDDNKHTAREYCGEPHATAQRRVRVLGTSCRA